MDDTKTVVDEREVTSPEVLEKPVRRRQRNLGSYLISPPRQATSRLLLT